jgi:Tfp pilus assembly protein PilF
MPFIMDQTRDLLATGWKLIQAGELARAEVVYRQIVQSDPSLTQAWFQLATATQLQGKLSEAITNYGRVLELSPHHVEALNNLGVALQGAGLSDEALASLRQAVRFNPSYADAHNNLGNALQALGELDAAEASYRRAIALKPNSLDANHNLGNVLRAQGRLAQSIASYDRAVALAPNRAQVHLSRSMALLQTGDFERGWPEFEWRFQCKEYSIPDLHRPRWNGDSLAGRTILLYADHGLGDTIQFIRYTSLVKDFGGQVIVACQKPIARLIASCPGVDAVFAEGDQLPEFDVYAPVMSLPNILGTTLGTVPNAVPYLIPDAALVRDWRRQLEPPTGFTIGIAWQGNPRYARDRQRSVPLACFESLARVPGIRLFSLHKGFGVEQLAEIEGRFIVTDLGSQCNLTEAAAVMKSLNLVIAPDTALAHLAGAVSARVWVALSFAPDWRWLLERTDSPWYPTMQLFRQKTWGGWSEVFQRMATELQMMINAQPSGPSAADSI